MTKIWGYAIDHDMCNGFCLLSTLPGLHQLFRHCCRLWEQGYSASASHYANCHSLSGGDHDTLLLFSSCWINFSSSSAHRTLALTMLYLYTFLVVLTLVKYYICGTGVSMVIRAVGFVSSFLINSFIHIQYLFFDLARVMMNPEPIPGPLRVSRKNSHWIGCQSIMQAHSASCRQIHIFIHTCGEFSLVIALCPLVLGGWWNHVNVGRACRNIHRQNS